MMPESTTPSVVAGASPAPTSPARVLVLLCTYNERQNLPIIVAEVRQTIPHADVLVVDDNSPDGTGAWAMQAQESQAGLHVIVRSGKLGLGSALRDGMQWCLARNYDFLINLDADQSHDPRQIAQLLAPALSDGERRTVSIGSRYTAGGQSSGLSPQRKLLSRMLNWYGMRLLNLPVRDCSGSYRCYPILLLKHLDFKLLTCNGYGFLEEILVYLADAGARFIEVPITYHARGAGLSKLSTADAVGALAVIHRLSRFSRRRRH